MLDDLGLAITKTAVAKVTPKKIFDCYRVGELISIQICHPHMLGLDAPSENPVTIAYAQQSVVYPYRTAAKGDVLHRLWRR